MPRCAWRKRRFAAEGAGTGAPRAGQPGGRLVPRPVAPHPVFGAAPYALGEKRGPSTDFFWAASLRIMPISARAKQPNDARARANEKRERAAGSAAVPPPENPPVKQRGKAGRLPKSKDAAMCDEQTTKSHATTLLLRLTRGPCRQIWRGRLDQTSWMATLSLIRFSQQTNTDQVMGGQAQNVAKVSDIGC